MARNFINANDLRAVSFPTSKSGYEIEKVDAVMALCAGTIEDLENQVQDLQRAVALARAEAAPLELAVADDEDVIAQWLTTLDPLDIDREVQKTIAEAIVESTMAASHIRSEARERVKALIDAVAHEVQRLVGLVRDSKKSVAAAEDLPHALTSWEAEFSGRIGTLLTQLQLPWTVQVSQLAKVLSHMAEQSDTDLRNEFAENVHTSIKRRTTKSSSDDDAFTVKGDWS